MKKINTRSVPTKKRWICCLFLLLLGYSVSAQQSIVLDMSALDGVEINAKNLFNYQVQSSLNHPVACTVKGSLRYRNSGLNFYYSYTYTVKPGINVIAPDQVHPVWQFSSSALRELLLTYNKLPQGTYEYCVSVTPQGGGNEQIPGNVAEECLFYKVDDVFLINLLDPENDAKIYEYNPMLSWTVNYPFASELTYRIRVCELKKGQHPTNAVMRNNPVYDEKNLVQTSISYPIYARPLQVFQPYVWTVDAYYKGLLLGGSEVWKFTIIEDSLLKAVPHEQSYADIRKEEGNVVLYATGTLKLKYELKELRNDTLQLRMYDVQRKEVKLKENVLRAHNGDNRYELNFYERQPLKHGSRYLLELTSRTGAVYRVLFVYINPELLK